jgi:hypothetical protein
MTGLILRLGVLCGLLVLLGWGGVAAWREATRPPHDVSLPAATPSTPAQARDLALVKPPLSSFSDTLKRPLFFEGRKYPERRPEPVVAPSASSRPAVLVAPTPPAPPPKPLIAVEAVKPATTDGLKLLGVLVNKGRTRALIEAAPDAGEWLGVGGKVRDWTIESIGADRVALRQGRQTATLELYRLSTTSPPSRVR